MTSNTLATFEFDEQPFWTKYGWLECSCSGEFDIAYDCDSAEPEMLAIRVWMREGRGLVTIAHDHTDLWHHMATRLLEDYRDRIAEEAPSVDAYAEHRLHVHELI